MLLAHWRAAAAARGATAPSLAHWQAAAARGATHANSHTHKGKHMHAKEHVDLRMPQKARRQAGWRARLKANTHVHVCTT